LLIGQPDVGGDPALFRASHSQEFEAYTLSERCSRVVPSLSHLQKAIAPHIFNGLDFYDEAAVHWSMAHEYRELYCLHALQKLYTERKLVLRHNLQLAMKAGLNQEGSSEEEEVREEQPKEKAKKLLDDETEDDKFRDQGFTRPSMLIIVPFRNTAYDVIRTLQKQWALITGHPHLDNSDRIDEEYGSDSSPSLSQSDGDHDREHAYNLRGNVDDCFRIGLKCTKRELKAFTEFYSSDVLVCSPLGLRLVVEGQSERRTFSQRGRGGKKGVKRIKRKGDSDFLSSIQLLIMDEAHILAHQNWDHLHTVLAALNHLPKESHGCDFSRVKSLFLDGHARFTRQNIVLSAYAFPELNALLANRLLFSNVKGAVKRSYTEHCGVLSLLKSKSKLAPQLHLLPEGEIEKAPEQRLAYFMQELLPWLDDGTAIFISSYLDFSVLRHALESREIPLAVLSEYATGPEISAARTRFYNGHAKLLLVSERFHFFHGYKVRGIKQLMFYSLPENKRAFLHWALSVEGNGDLPIIVSPFDALKAERILGTKRFQKLVA